MASKRKVRRRVAKALKKYVRGNPGPRSIRKTKKRIREFDRSLVGVFPKGSPMRKAIERRKISAERLARTIQAERLNPPRVKGRKTKGGRAVTLKNFTGTIVKKSDGTVQIVGRGRRK